jgi:serine/threonine-protein kinase
MNAALWARAKDLIAEALERPESERDEFLEEACADPGLLAEIRTLFEEFTPELLNDVLTVSTRFETPPGDDSRGDELLPATFVGPYAVIEQLGVGGMGRVYLANDTRLKRRVALKCLLSSKTGSDDMRERILQEARAAARISHPNVATIYDVIEHGDRVRAIGLLLLVNQQLAPVLDHDVARRLVLIAEE